MLINKLSDLTPQNIEDMNKCVAANPNPEFHWGKGRGVRYHSLDVHGLRRALYILKNDTELEDNDIVHALCSRVTCLNPNHLSAISAPHIDLAESLLRKESEHVDLSHYFSCMYKEMGTYLTWGNCWVVPPNVPKILRGSRPYSLISPKPKILASNPGYIMYALFKGVDLSPSDKAYTYGCGRRYCVNPNHMKALNVTKVDSPDEIEYSRAIDDTEYMCSDDMKEEAYGRMIREDLGAYRDVLVCHSHKIIYETEDQSLKSIALWRALKVSKGCQMERYQCAICHYWHLTSRYG